MHLKFYQKNKENSFPLGAGGLLANINITPSPFLLSFGWYEENIHFLNKCGVVVYVVGKRDDISQRWNWYEFWTIFNQIS